MAVEPLLRWPASHSPNLTGQNNGHFVVIIPSCLRSRSVCWSRASQRTKTLGTGRFLTHPSLYHLGTPVSTLRVCAVVHITFPKPMSPLLLPTPVAGLIPLKIVSKYCLVTLFCLGRRALTLTDKTDTREGENTREPPLAALAFHLCPNPGIRVKLWLGLSAFSLAFRKLFPTFKAGSQGSCVCQAVLHPELHPQRLEYSISLEAGPVAEDRDI